MNSYKLLIFLYTLSICLVSCGPDEPMVELTGEQKKWHKLELSFKGPAFTENGTENPFLDYRLQVQFRNGEKVYTIPGFFAADGNAAETSADSGNVWRVRFVPDMEGEWVYKASFRKGPQIVINADSAAGEAIAFDGMEGRFEIGPTDKQGRDFRAKGRLQYVGEHYQRHAETGELFIKVGADSPENFLGYAEFDNTYYGGNGERRIGEAGPNQTMHTYAPHLRDYNVGDPTWQEGKGQGIIGALNYLAESGMNSVYMLTNNVKGDGQDVFPWIEYDTTEFLRFDVSKLAQWEKVFSHMDEQGLMCHFVTQETENELMLNNGELGLERKLYYRELIARFAHHLALTWNLGEENGVAPWLGFGQTDQQRKDMANYIKQTDPYKNLVVLHTLPTAELRDSMLAYLLPCQGLNGPSLQTQPNEVHEATLKWRSRSAKAGNKWVVCSDEIGPHTTGALPDEVDPEHNEIRHQVLWGNLMAGGAGVEWYFGYEHPHTDLNCEDWRSRNNLWEQSRIAHHFFTEIIPLDKMEPADSLAVNSEHYCMQGEGMYVLYLPKGDKAGLLNQPAGSYSVQWFNPRSGGELIPAASIELPTAQALSTEMPPHSTDKDWVVIIKRSG